MELILCEILNCRRIDLYLNYDRPLKADELDKLHKYILLAAKSIPLQYIFGRTQFMGLDLTIDKRALIPRPETEQLARFAIDFLTNSSIEPISVLDIGTGSGCLAIAIAYYLQQNRRNYTIDAIDNSADALEVAKINAHKYNLDNIKFRLLDVLQENFSAENYNCIVSNPPYIPLNNYKELDPKIVKNEPKSALTDYSDGLTFYRKFNEISKTMQKGAIMILEIEGNNTGELLNIFNRQNYKIEIIKDFADIDRIMVLKIE